MLQGLLDLWRAFWAWWRGPDPQAAESSGTDYFYGPVVIRRFDEITTDPPPMHWSPCHASTIRRFKASMTCSEGHGLTLRGHSISPEGNVSPSVVCPHPGCRFHVYVRLENWSFGAVA